MTQVFLYKGVTSFPDPGDWNPIDNTVECVGSGGMGGIAAQFPPLPGVPWPQRIFGAGGGAGAYAQGQDLSPSFPVPVGISTANQASTVFTWFGGTTPGLGNVYAACGLNATQNNATSIPTPNQGGSGINGVTAYPVGYHGGAGGGGRNDIQVPTPGEINWTVQPGGGGAGGPNAPAVYGYQPIVPEYASFGGAPNSETGGGDQSLYPLNQQNISGDGLIDYIWDSVHGVGGGGNGGGDVIISATAPANPYPGTSYWDGTTLWIFDVGDVWRAALSTTPGTLDAGNGSPFGGAGGGAVIQYGGTSGAAGQGSDGIIVITWTDNITPKPPPPPPEGSALFVPG